MGKVNLKPNSRTYLNLIKGYLSTNNYEDGQKLFEKAQNDLNLSSLLNLHSYLLTCLKDERLASQSTATEILTSLNESVLNKIPQSFNQNERLIFTDNLFDLCSSDRNNEAINLIKRFFISEYSQIDPIKRAIDKLRLDVA